jgi:sialate O-acetylesterase
MKFLNRAIIQFCFLMTLCVNQLEAAVTLPKIFSNNMMLQRDRAVKVWGWADKGESVTVTFNGQKIKTKAGSNGQWMVSLIPMVFGGPYDMNVAGKSRSVTLTNILIGDIWICSGQSNMEWILKNTNNAEKEIAESNYPKIRLFTVAKETGFKARTDLSGTWMECNAGTSGDFSAVAYFFARKLLGELNVPVGLINTSWGGTNIQTWMSGEVISKMDEYKNTKLPDEQSQEQIKKNRDAYLFALKHDKGKIEKWYDPSRTGAGWKKIKLPQEWSDTEIGNTDGIVWFKKEFELPASSDPKKIILSLGPIDDADVTYLNGTLVDSTNMWNKDRLYSLSKNILKPGKNILIIKVTDTGGGGGLFGKPEQLYVQVDDQKISLAGDWEYKVSVLTSDFGLMNSGPNAYPTLLYNAMIAPLTSFGIKGAIWYQGEANTFEANRYRKLFAEMIRDWRSKWGYDFPFFWVQLANFMAPDTTPAGSDWAELREAQQMTLSLPSTGQAVIIDIGEEKDIHPRNKQDVGYRLALAALKVAYGKDIVFSGPVYQSMKVDGNKIILTFSSTGSGLNLKDIYGYAKGFAIAGEDQKFVWAQGYVEGNTVIVFNKDISHPVAVRYAWGNNPNDANLYNKEGLPASPFRTDTWKGITQ